MWLLNARTLQLEYFEGDQIPPYAILSHRWETEEITFQDVRCMENRSKKGWRKVEAFCKTVIDSVYSEESDLTELDLKDLDQTPIYCWVDTCCIDKTNSAELSEAINSMYNWYRNAYTCFAYLSDVVTDPAKDIETAFRKSVWFTRCWTLQELVAPRSVRFWDSHWRLLGSRWTLGVTISKITGISNACLRGISGDSKLHPRDQLSISEIMSWASGRQSTRIEDEAYSLLGLFNVNMPLIYGEGRKAFSRLQDEILKVSKDQTIFAWGGPNLFPNTPADSRYGGHCIFQPSPALYRNPGVILEKCDAVDSPGFPWYWGSFASEIQPTIVSGFDIATDMYLIPHSHNVYFVMISALAYRPGSPLQLSNAQTFKCILIMRDSTDGRFVRCVTADGKYIFNAPQHWRKFGNIRRVVLKRTILSEVYLVKEIPATTYGVRLILVHLEGVDAKHISLISYVPSATPDALVMCVGTYGVVGMLVFRKPHEFLKLLLLGFDFDFNPFCLFIMPKQYNQQPIDVKITAPELNLAHFPINRNCYVMELVNRLRKLGRNISEPSRDLVELHYGSWKDTGSVFRINDIGRVQLVPTLDPNICFQINIVSGNNEVEDQHRVGDVYSLPCEGSARFQESKSWADIQTCNTNHGYLNTRFTHGGSNRS